MSFLNDLFEELTKPKAKVEVEVTLPDNMTSMDLYKIFKEAAEKAGAELTGFEVKK
jgi:hypothetical protein